MTITADNNQQGDTATLPEPAGSNDNSQPDGQRHAELTESTVRDRTTVTRLLDGMVDKGLVRSVRSSIATPAHWCSTKSTACLPRCSSGWPVVL